MTGWVKIYVMNEGGIGYHDDVKAHNNQSKVFGFKHSNTLIGQSDFSSFRDLTTRDATVQHSTG